jgi:predicted transposase/invertase (TIGR01784 family)
MLNYAVTLTKVEAGERIFNFVDEVLINKTDIIMTYGQVLRNEGMERGIEQGLEQGIEQGLEQGIERGIAQERIKIAGRMLYNGAPLEQVQQWTGVSEAEVKYCAKQR